MEDVMMSLGIFESIFPEPSIDAKFARVRQHGFSAVQIDLASAGLPTLPDALPDAIVGDVLAASKAHEITIAALAGTFNMIDLDVDTRHINLRRLMRLIESAPLLGTNVVTICTGTRDAGSMWKKHPDNSTPEAWSDLIATLGPAIRAAEEHGVVLAVEPEPANVVSNAIRAGQLLEEIGSSSLAIIADPANLIAGDREHSASSVLDAAFELLGDRIVLAHAKDLDATGEFCAAGTGIVPWEHFAELLRKSNYDGAIVCHSLTVNDIDLALTTLQRAGIGTEA